MNTTIQERLGISRAISSGRYSRSGDEAALACPRCPAGKSPKLYVNLRSGLFVCFRCGDLRGRIGRAPSRAWPEEEGSAGIFDPDSLSPPLVDLAGSSARRAREYLHRRGLSGEEIREAEIRLRDSYAAFPIRDAAGICRGWIGRRFRLSGPRYWIPPATPKRDLVWGIDRVRKDRPVVVVEGIFDALAGRRAVPDLDWVALMGSSLSIPQARSIAAVGEAGAIVLLDDDAEEKALAAARILGLMIPVIRGSLPAGIHDPGSAPPEILRLCVSAARSRLHEEALA